MGLESVCARVPTWTQFGPIIRLALMVGFLMGIYFAVMSFQTASNTFAKSSASSLGHSVGGSLGNSIGYNCGNVLFKIGLNWFAPALKPPELELGYTVQALTFAYNYAPLPWR